MQRLRKGDEVIAIAGKDKGRRGTVLKIVGDQRLLVEGLNMVKKHIKANPNQGVTGGITDKEMPMQISNVGIYNSQTSKVDRVGFKVLEDGSKVRYFKSNNEVIDV